MYINMFVRTNIFNINVKTRSFIIFFLRIEKILNLKFKKRFDQHPLVIISYIEMKKQKSIQKTVLSKSLK